MRRAPLVGLAGAAALVWLILLTAVAPAAAQDFPRLTGRVVDQADILSPATERDLEARSAALEQATSDQLVVVTVADLQGYDISDYGYRLGRAWGIGQAGQNNGVLLIVAPNERKVRVEVGYGLEGILTDGLSHLIIQEQILPRFRRGEMEAGVVAGVAALTEHLTLDREEAAARAKAADARVQGEELPGWAVILIVLFIAFFARFWIPFFLWGALAGGGGSWRGGGGGFGGGGFGGGGGSFGGGGASGGW